jgi:hypothetical protein
MGLGSAASLLVGPPWPPVPLVVAANGKTRICNWRLRRPVPASGGASPASDGNLKPRGARCVQGCRRHHA